MFEKLQIYADVERFWEAVNKLADNQCKRLAVKEWLEFLRVRPNTLQGADVWMRATILQAEAFLEWQAEKPGNSGRKRSPGTIHTRTTKIRLVSKQLHALGFLKSNIFAPVKIPSLKRDQRQKAPNLTGEQASRLIRGFDISTAKGRRNRAIFALLFGAGLRHSEIPRLCISDLRRSDTGAVYLVLRNTKSGPDQIQAIAPDMAQLVELYCEERQMHEYVKPDSALIGRRIDRPQPLTKEGIRKLFERHTKHLGIRATTHSGRRTAINRLLQAGVDIMEVKVWARHKSVLTTQEYVEEQQKIDHSPAQKLKF